MEQIKTYGTQYHRAKMKQFVFTIVIAVLFLIFFIFDEGTRVNAVQSIPALVFSILFFIFLISSIIFTYIDLIKYEKVIVESDDIRKSAYLDDMTGMPNRFSCDLIFQMYASPEDIKHVGCALIVIGNLVTINSTYGRDAGNQVIMDFSQILTDISEDFGFIGRNGGNEFLLVINDCNEQLMQDFFKQLDVRLSRYNVLNLNHPIGFYYKYVLNDVLQADRFSDIITEVYRRLHTSPARKEKKEK